MLRLSVVAVLTLLAGGCQNVCVTILDSCRGEPDAGITGPILDRDAGLPPEDAGTDAGFLGCIEAECVQACEGVTMPAHVCITPACRDCQAVFCGRFYSCGRDAAVPTDASVDDAAIPDATVPDAAVPDAGAPDAAVSDAATPDAATSDANVPDAATTDAAMPDAATMDAALPDASPGDAGGTDAALHDAGGSDAGGTTDAALDAGGGMDAADAG